MKCRNCGCSDIKKITIKGLPKGINAFICIRCWNIQLEPTEQYKKSLIKKYAKQSERKAIKEIIKDAN